MSLLPEYSQPSDPLPGYTPGLDYYGLALIKTEFFTPYDYNNRSRSWKPVLLHLNSTQLNIYDLNAEKKLVHLIVCLYMQLNCLDELAMQMNLTYKKNAGANSETSSSNEDSDLGGDAYGGNRERSLFNDSKLSKLKLKLTHQRNQKTLSLISNYYDLLCDNKFLFEPTNSLEDYRQFMPFQGPLLNSYSLTHLQLGEAPSLNQIISAMYKEENVLLQQSNSSLVRYKNVLRLRIEYKQILLQFWSFPSMVNWYRNFIIGRDLSCPLEMRNVSKLKSILSTNSPRANELLHATAAAAGFGRLVRDNEDELELEAAIRSGNLLSKEDRENAIDDSDDAPSTINQSLFERRNSRTTVDSATSLISEYDSITICGYKFYSTEGKFTTLEKQYISNCIPDLNSFDKWTGKLITISNVDHFVKDETESDIYINSGSLSSLVCSLDKNAHKIKTHGHTKTFLIHRTGLYEFDLNA